MKSSWVRAVALVAVLQVGGSACRQSARQPAPPSAEQAGAAKSVTQSGPSIDLRDCAAVRAGNERWLANLGSALSEVLAVDEPAEDAAAGDANAQLPRRDLMPGKYTEKLAELLGKGALCERSPRGTWFIRYAPTELAAQPPGDVIVPWSLVHVGPDGKSVELAADPEDSSSADWAATQHEANKGAPPQRPRFIAAVGARFYIAERTREDGELSLPESLVLFDYDGDGEEEAILTEHSNSLGRQERTVTLWSWKAGRIVPYAPAWQRLAEAARDVDGDGRPDLLYRPYWGEKGPGGAALALAHALPNGTFSTSDTAVAAFSAKQPPPLPVRADSPAERVRDPLAPPPLARTSPRPPTGMLCKREYERTRALLIGASSYFARQHVPATRASAEGLRSLLRARSFCVPAHAGAWAVSFIGYQFGGAAMHAVVARWSLMHLGLDGTRVAYAVPPRPLAETAAAKADPMLPFDDDSGLSLTYYTDDAALKLSCRTGYDLPSSLRVVDYDQKGEEEAIFSTASEELGCDSEKAYLDPVAILTLRDGKVVPYDEKWHRHFDELKDLDRDGRPDLLYRPYRTPSNLEAACPQLEASALREPFVHGPLFAAHALPQGGFSTVDQVAKDYARALCPQRIKAAAVLTQSKVAEEARLCARIWGLPAKAAERDLDATGPCAGCADCEERRRLKEWLERTPPLHLP